MSLNELLPPNQDAYFPRGEQEVIDPAEHYLRLKFEDLDLAERYLETLIANPIKRVAISANAVAIMAALPNIQSKGKAYEDRIARLIDEYKDLFHSYLIKESIAPVEPIAEPPRVRAWIDKLIRGKKINKSKLTNCLFEAP